MVLGALSADCPVILFADHDKKVIGIAHAGWRSARAGIIESCVHTMFSPVIFSAVISPCITQPSYEVDSEFYKQIISDSPMYSEYFNC
ncbi:MULTISPECIES: laccase domain-containing protein [Legionella]|uniref:laccase domain-containing protein n=1 Tax=Legionella TaxID=445 RepID=UPI001AC40839|nr:laccase domain-containing protein [Legionella steelei]